MLVGVAIALLLVMLYSNTIFNQSLAEHLQRNTDERLAEIVTPNLVSFDLQMQEQIKKVNTLAAILGQSESLNSPEHVELLQAVVTENNLLRCVIAFPDGTFITNDWKNDGNVSEDDFFKASMNGEFFISDPRPAVVDPSKTVMLFSAPIEKDGQIMGVVIYSYLCENMDAIFNLSFLNNQGRMMIVKQDGTPLIGESPYSAPDTENILATMREQCTHEGHLPTVCLALSNDSGTYSISFSDAQSPLIVQYSRLSYNDWYMVSMVPQVAANASLSAITDGQRTMTLIIVCCVAIYCMVIMLLWIFQQSNVDKLTGALTLHSFRRKAKGILRRRSHQKYMVVRLDIKNFKLINRIYDFTVGDAVIKNVAKALSATISSDSNSIFARAGIDDYLILLPFTNREFLDVQRDDFIATFRRLMGPDFTTTVEFPTGQYIITDTDYPRPDITEILEKVNFAHRAAKQSKISPVIDYVEDLEKEALFEKKVGDQMYSSLQNDEFRLYLQPKFRTCDQMLCGAEALVRWTVGSQSFLHPKDFIPVLERNGFIVKIDFYMFRLAAQQLQQVLAQGHMPVPISVNFSRCHLSNENFVQELCAIADEYHVPHEYLEIELTESTVYEHVDRMIELTAQLHEAGFVLSLDDFGTGYSSLSLVKDLNIDVLKIDKSFFDNCLDSQRAQVVLKHIFNMAQELGVTTVAEGIELKGQVDLLKTLGCDIIQGFYFSKPVPAEQVNLMDRTVQ